MRAGEALATTVALFLLLFAAVYFVMDRASPASFSHHLTRTDSLYFTVTTFSTVGYGDITAASQAARLLVTVQMILDLLALGLGIRVFIGAVQLARQARPAPAVRLPRVRLPRVRRPRVRRPGPISPGSNPDRGQVRPVAALILVIWPAVVVCAGQTARCVGTSGPECAFAAR